MRSTVVSTPWLSLMEKPDGGTLAFGKHLRFFGGCQHCYLLCLGFFETFSKMSNVDPIWQWDVEEQGTAS